ncbi:hypothetical protein [Curtobacterium sp. UNCCL20]|uniref:hypothetical protein n=1 Tax=Curtobacterium sp. UNCCL20 TaxID=1502773 RepID=UPI001C319490|nr:hypothetical protein [Curtobacterium sp. UNCCL20]
MAGAFVAVAALVVSVADGRAGRRNTEFLAHRDQWWNRWSWVAERATSQDEDQQDAAMIMASALTTRRWTTDDDTWVLHALEEHDTRRAAADHRPDEGNRDDLRHE